MVMFVTGDGEVPFDGVQVFKGGADFDAGTFTFSNGAVFDAGSFTFNNGAYFYNFAPATTVTGLGNDHLVRRQDFLADQSLQNVLFLTILAGYLPLTSVTAYTLTLLDDANAAAARTTLDAAQATHTHVGTEVSIDDSGFGGVLRNEGVTNVQLLAEWIDDNIVLG